MMDSAMNQDPADAWDSTMFLYRSALKKVNTKIEILRDEFSSLHKYNPIEHVTSRIKSPESIVKKLRHYGREINIENMVECVKDIAGLRVICSFTTDIYTIASMLEAQTDVKILGIKDYIRNPKPNGYRSYHMLISIPIFTSDNVVDVKVEIQIRTIAMDFWASLEHKIHYKFEGNAPDYMWEQLKECADIVWELDSRMLSLNQKILQAEVPDRSRETAATVETDVIKLAVPDNSGETA